MNEQTCIATSGVCITCSDAVEVLRIESISPDGLTAICLDGLGGRTDTMLDLVPGVQVGAEVLVHAGVALLEVDERPSTRAPSEKRQ